MSGQSDSPLVTKIVLPAIQVELLNPVYSCGTYACLVTIGTCVSSYAGTMSPDSPTKEPWAYGYHVGSEVGVVSIHGCGSDLVGQYGQAEIHDETGEAKWRSTCR